MTQRFLLLADNSADADAIQAMLMNSSLDYELLRVGTGAEFVKALSRNEFALILADYALTDFDGISALEIACEQCPDVPFIFVSGSLGEELAIAALQQGATDYVLKQRLERLVPAIERALRLGQERRNRLLAEQACHESEADLHALFNLINVGMAQADPITRSLRRVNAAFCEMTGYTEQELLAMTIDEINHPDDLDRDRALFMRMVDGVANNYQSEKRYVRKDGSIVWVLAKGNIIRDAQGRPLRTIAVINDITELKQTEQALRDAEERLRVALQNAPITVFNQNCELKYTWIHNPVLHDLPEMLGKSDRDFLSPDNAEPLTAIKQQVLETGIGAREEIRIIRHDRDYYYDLTIEPLLSSSQEIIGITCAAIDVTERKHAEINLRKSEERLRLAMDAAHLGTWDIDLITGKAIWSELHFILLGYESSPTGEATEAMWMSRIHPEDLDRVIQEWQQSRQECRLYRAEYRVIKADNQQVVWIAVLGSFTYNQSGDPVRSVGVVYDISDRKRHERNTEFLADISQDLALTISINEILAIVANKMCNYFGFSLLKFSEINATTDIARVIYCNHNLNQENALSEYRLTDDLSNSQIEHLQAGEVVAINDILIAPCINDGRLKLVVIGHCQTTSNWRSEEIELMQELATRIWIRIENARAEDNLRRSEEEFRTIANAAPALVWVCSPNGEVIFFNDRWYDFTRQTKAEAIGQGWSQIMHPEDAVRILPYWENCQKTGAIYEGEVRYRRHDGEYRWHAFRALPRRDANGQIEAWYGLSIDITERIQAEAALKESEARYRHLVEAIPQLVWTADGQGQTNYVNQQMCDYTGLSYDEWLKLNCQNIIHPDDFELISQRWVESLQNSIPYQVEYRLRRSDGAYRWHLVRAIPFKDEQGKVIQWFGVSTDIHYKQELAKQRSLLLQKEQAAREEAERANRIKDEFLAVLSHELRSPLNPILGWSQLLQTQKLSPETATKGLATIERNAKLQVQLIDDLLDVSRILRGKLVLKNNPVNLVTTIEAALETVNLAAVAKNIQIQTQLDSGIVCGDATRLQQIIWNLLTNAVKFTPQGGQVEVRLACVDGFAQIQVQDTGKGISPEFLPYVFDYFRQEDGTTTRKFGGLGLGLAIVRHLVELHGGTVQADSPGENLGATFTVQLPLMPIQPRVNSDSQLGKLAVNLSGIQVLVVDDETDTRNLIAFLLQQSGATVITAASALEAFTALRRRPPDVLISDIGMPEIDGYMLLRQIRALPPDQGGKIKAIALTAYAGELDRELALSVGFQQHIPKPVETETLLRAIASLINSAGVDGR